MGDASGTWARFGSGKYVPSPVGPEAMEPVLVANRARNPRGSCCAQIPVKFSASSSLNEKDLERLTWISQIVHWTG